MVIIGGGVFAPIASAQAVTASTVTMDNTIKIDKETDNSVSGTVMFNGKLHTFSFRVDGSRQTISIDNQIVLESDKTGAWLGTTASLTKSLKNGKVNFKHGGHSYYYVNTVKYTSGQMNKVGGLLSFVIGGLSGLVSGGASWAFSIASALKSISSSSKNYWYSSKVYCSKNYKYYAYKLTAYKNAKRTKVAYRKTSYQTMF